MLRAHPRRRCEQHRRDQVPPLGWSGGVVQTRVRRAKQQLAPAAGPAPGRPAPPTRSQAQTTKQRGQCQHVLYSPHRRGRIRAGTSQHHREHAMRGQRGAKKWHPGAWAPRNASRECSQSLPSQACDGTYRKRQPPRWHILHWRYCRPKGRRRVRPEPRATAVCAGRRIRSGRTEIAAINGAAGARRQGRARGMNEKRRGSSREHTTEENAHRPRVSVRQCRDAPYKRTARRINRGEGALMATSHPQPSGERAAGRCPSRKRRRTVAAAALVAACSVR